MNDNSFAISHGLVLWPLLNLTTLNLGVFREARLRQLIALLLSAIVAAALVAFLLRSRAGREAGSSAEQPSKASPPNAKDVADRVLCLAALVTRAKIEYNLHPSPPDLPNPNQSADQKFVDNQKSWLVKEGLWGRASSIERDVFDKSFGAWTRQEIADGQWREESLAMLIWALSPDVKMPPYDTPGFNQPFMNLVPGPTESRKFADNAKLRDSAEISKARDVAELWLWRARTTQLQRNGTRPPKGLTFEEIISMSAEGAEKEGLFRSIDGDFPAFNKSYAKVSDQEWKMMTSIATERLYALNWLCGYAKDWDEVPTDT